MYAVELVAVFKYLDLIKDITISSRYLGSIKDL